MVRPEGLEPPTLGSEVDSKPLVTDDDLER
jgi:hypothetical protein